MRLGDLLINIGYITPEQLQEALDIQEETRELLGIVLVDLNYISNQTLLEVLDIQLGTINFKKLGIL